MFLIRLARKSDIDRIVEIEKTCYPEPWERQGFECEFSKLNSGINIFFVAEDEVSGRVAGYFVGNVITDYVHILNIAVSDEFRRRGIALSFMQKAVQEALKRGLSAMTLEVRESNEAAVNLYRRLGFEVRGRREKYYEGKYDGLLMWKRL
ncbi:MAG TPA: ribosomal protein S18-alanine N-acetyltransferase [Candidatus Goldiibacteriota bacterium]|nr:ribosomal protein S18-alanine N-acetyltransferase [Candidatus Goldiibacteriota bacterium]